MRSELAENLKTVLDNMSQEQFDKEWNEIVEQNKEVMEITNGIHNIKEFEQLTK